MTLLEMMAVATVVGVVGTGVGVSAMNAKTERQVLEARAQLVEIAKALEAHKVSVGRYPTTTAGLAALTRPEGGGAPLLGGAPVDPWGHEYSYLRPGTRNPRKFDLVSRGPDGIEGTADDVGNWPEARR